MAEENHQVKPFAYIFDFGGVIFDWDPYYLYRNFIGNDREKVNRFLEEIGFNDWNLEQDRGRPFEVAVSVLSARFPQHADLIRAYHTHYEQTIQGVFEPTIAILKKLKDKGYPLYALSNWSAEKFTLIRPRYSFLKWFDDMIISGEEKLVKPDPLIFEVVLKRAGRKAEECILVDDHYPNIETAQKMGFKTIHYQSPEQLSDALSMMGYINNKVR